MLRPDVVTGAEVIPPRANVPELPRSTCECEPDPYEWGDCAGEIAHIRSRYDQLRQIAQRMLDDMRDAAAQLDTLDRAGVEVGRWLRVRAQRAMIDLDKTPEQA